MQKKRYKRWHGLHVLDRNVILTVKAVHLKRQIKKKYDASILNGAKT